MQTELMREPEIMCDGYVNRVTNALKANAVAN
jgi:hypothetical protein